MKSKKLFASAMAMAMAMSMSLPTFAADTDLTQSTEIAGTTSAPTIKIVVPATGSIVLNPYNMEYDLDGEGEEEETDNAAIISATQYIENYSNVNIEVKASATGTVAGKAVLAKESTVPEEGGKPITTNSAYLEFEMTVVDEKDEEVTWAEVSAEDKKTVAVAAAGGTKVTTSDALTLAAGNGTTALADEGGVAAYHLTGDIVAAPTTPWVAEDTISVAVAFTFNPVALETT